MNFFLRKDFFYNRSIKSKVIILISSLIALAMLLITLVVVYIVNANMSEQTYALLQNRAHSIHERLEQRMGYLIDNSVLLTKSELMINALTDAKERETYLPPLVGNFMEGKDVVSLNIVDFDGRAIFQTQKNIPLYNSSSQLRSALALGEVSYYMQERDSQLVVVSPIEYYQTTQGAAVIVFDISKIVNRNKPEHKSMYMKLLKDKKSIFTYNFDKSIDYKQHHHSSENYLEYFKQLGLSLEIGIPSNIYAAPVRDVVVKLLILGTIFVGVGILFSTVLANAITNPILELYSRVKASSRESEIFCSPLGTNDELEELAKAFDERTLSLQYQAEHDALTRLPNRVLFMDRLRQNINNAPRNKDEFAVLFLDLDHFKEVNDSFGHDFGDELLMQVGTNLKTILRVSDSVARMGGDEFTILVNNISNEDSIVPTLQKIMLLFQEPFKIKDHKFYITCSIGIAVYPLNGNTPELLLKNADAAMYKAKEMGRNTYQFYTKDMTEKAYERITLETEMRQAIVNKEFEVYFQPQVTMDNEHIVGMEALVRWNHPTKGLVPPIKFIPLAEETGLIVEIDRIVMQDAILQFKKWIDDGLNPGVLSINLSMIQLNHEDFIDFVKKCIAKSQIEPNKLIFEVTETQIMKNPEQAILMLQHLKSIGIKLAIDDFGTGHSSLSYIKKLPIDKLKIDQSFVRDVTEDKDDAELTRAIISISKSLNLEIIGEGVETKEQAMFLMKNGCNEAQGYLYYKPQNSQSIRKILATKRAETT